MLPPDWREVDIAVDDAEQRRDGRLVRGDAVEVAHLAQQLDRSRSTAKQYGVVPFLS